MVELEGAVDNPLRSKLLQGSIFSQSGAICQSMFDAAAKQAGVKQRELFAMVLAVVGKREGVAREGAVGQHFGRPAALLCDI